MQVDCAQSHNAQFLIVANPQTLPTPTRGAWDASTVPVIPLTQYGSDSEKTQTFESLMVVRSGPDISGRPMMPPL